MYKRQWSSSRPRDISVDSEGKVKAIAGLGYSELSVRLVGTDIKAKILLDVTDPSFFSSSNAKTATAITDPVVLKPLIGSLSLTSGVPGQTLVITGSNFSVIQSENVIKIGNVVAEIVSVTATSITVKIPNVAVGEQNISVSVNNEVSLAQTFKICLLYTSPSPRD